MKFSSLQASLRLILVNVIISYQILRCQSFSTSLHVEDGSIRSSGGESSSTGMAVSVFDNVIPPSSQDMLHVAASESGLGHKVFSRPIVNRDESPIIELALDAILTEMEQGGGEGAAGVNSMEMSSDDNVVPKQYVEYWTRQEFRHIEAHADVDEHLAKEHDASIANGEMTSSTSPPYRYPENGHVLYLKVGSEVQGPTCIFPKTSTGGQLIQKQEQQQEGDDKDAVDLIVVPAVNGRLLRFSGSALHAVPRPPDLWFLSFVKGAPKFKPEEEWGRSVILFNTWSGEEDPPKDVPAASRRSGTNTVMSSESMVNKREDWEDIFLWKDDNNKDKICTREDNIIDEATASKVKIWLLGNERRRDYPMRTIKMKAKSSARDAFLESTAVSHLTLEP